MYSKYAMDTQVSTSHYFQRKYSTLERFISYFYQVDLLRDLGGKKVLFIGVGDGIVSSYLEDRCGVDIVTYDFDAGLHPDIVGDVRNMPFKEEEFDAIALFEVLEHIPFEDLPKVIDDLHKISKQTVFVSVPFRHTALELTFKFPFIRSLLKRDLIRFNLSLPLIFPGFESSGQHYWEIDAFKFNIKKVRAVFEKKFKVIKEKSPILYSYQKFFVLEKL